MIADGEGVITISYLLHLDFQINHCIIDHRYNGRPRQFPLKVVYLLLCGYIDKIFDVDSFCRKL